MTFMNKHTPSTGNAAKEHRLIHQLANAPGQGGDYAGLDPDQAAFVEGQGKVESKEWEQKGPKPAEALDTAEEAVPRAHEQIEQAEEQTAKRTEGLKATLTNQIAVIQSEIDGGAGDEAYRVERQQDLATLQAELVALESPDAGDYADLDPEQAAFMRQQGQTEAPGEIKAEGPGGDYVGLDSEQVAFMEEQGKVRPAEAGSTSASEKTVNVSITKEDANEGASEQTEKPLAAWRDRIQSRMIDLGYKVQFEIDGNGKDFRIQPWSPGSDEAEAQLSAIEGFARARGMNPTRDNFDLIVSINQFIEKAGYFGPANTEGKVEGPQAEGDSFSGQGEEETGLYPGVSAEEAAFFGDQARTDRGETVDVGGAAAAVAEEAIEGGIEPKDEERAQENEVKEEKQDETPEEETQPEQSPEGPPKTHAERLGRLFDEAQKKLDSAETTGEKIAAGLEMLGVVLEGLKRIGDRSILKAPGTEGGEGAIEQAETELDAARGKIEAMISQVRSIPEIRQAAPDLAELLDDIEFTEENAITLNGNGRTALENLLKTNKPAPAMEALVDAEGKVIDVKAFVDFLDGVRQKIQSISSENGADPPPEANTNQKQPSPEAQDSRLLNIERNLQNAFTDSMVEERGGIFGLKGAKTLGRWIGKNLKETITGKDETGANEKVKMRNAISVQKDGRGKYAVHIDMNLANQSRLSRQAQESLRDPGVFRHQDRLANRYSTAPMTIDELENFAVRLKTRLG
jgi:hypothetical protein